MGTTNLLRILFVEDVPSDAELAEREIRKSGVEFTSTRVDTKEAFLSAMEEFRPDVIVSDYSMPEFDGMQALKLSLQHDSTIPFILLTGSMNEETAVACMKAGASDYVIKEHIKRLPFAVLEALEQKKTRAARDEADRALRASESSLEGILHSTADGILAVSKEQKIFFANDRFVQMWKIPPGTIEAIDDSTLLRSFLDQLIDPKGFLQRIEKLYESKEESFDTLLLKDGRTFEGSSRPLMQGVDMRGRVWSFRDITERKRAAEELKQSEDKFRAIFDNASDGMFLVDLKDRKFFESNATCAKMLGYTQKEFSNLDIADIHPQEDLPFIYEQIGKFTRGEEGIRSDIRFKRKDGSIFPADLSPALLTIAEEKYLLILFKDITERKQAEEDLGRSVAWQDAIFEGSRDAIFVSDADSRLVSVNQAACLLSGYSREELLRMRIPDLHEAEDLGAYKELHDRIMAGEESISEAKLRQKNGQKIDTEFNNTRIEISGTPYMHTTARDITERKRVEEAIQASNQVIKGILNAIPVRVFWKDESLVYLGCNSEFARDAGFESPDEIIGRSGFGLPSTMPHNRSWDDMAERISRKRKTH